MTGTVPPSIGELENLVYLQLEQNDFISTIPTEIGKLLFLEGLELNENSLTGVVPSQMGDLENLQVWIMLYDRSWLLPR